MTPFWRSKPSRLLVLNCFTIVAVAWLIPVTPLGGFFGFVPPPPLFYLVLIGIVFAYFALVELVKVWFYGRNAYRIEERAERRLAHAQGVTPSFSIKSFSHNGLVN